jgi:hypothetical protein
LTFLPLKNFIIVILYLKFKVEKDQHRYFGNLIRVNRLCIDSLILENSEQTHELFKICGFKSFESFKLLYRATKHGFSANDFHSKCDGHNNTLTIIKTNDGYIFGGYTTLCWSSKLTNDPDAFIFTLVNKQSRPMRINCVHPQQAISTYQNVGPVFGGYKNSYDIYISNNSNTNPSSSSFLGSSYNTDSLEFNRQKSESREFLAGNTTFINAEIEVFRKL